MTISISTNTITDMKEKEFIADMDNASRDYQSSFVEYIGLGRTRLNIGANSLSDAFKKGGSFAYELLLKDFRKNLLQFLADNITHGCDKGLILNILDYTTLIDKLSDKLGFDLMPLLKRDGYKADD